MSHVIGLKCRECGTEYPGGIQNTCYECFGPLEVHYDWDEIQNRASKEKISKGPPSIWRYSDLLPIDGTNYVDLGAGYNKLHRAENLGKELGLQELYILDDSVNPTNSFKDRVTSVAVSKALELGAEAVGCASTGNLASAVGAHAAKAGLPAYIFIPSSIEPGKITQMLTYKPNTIAVDGTYDDANRLASEVADLNPNWAFVNITIRPYYTEGSRTLAFETAEQLGWDTPDHIVAPLGSGALLCALFRGYNELENIGFVDNSSNIKFSGSQPLGCSPISTAVQNATEVVPIRELDTVAHSLAIGNPADGYYAKEIIHQSGGYAASPTDEEIIEAIRLLANTEGIFTEPAGGTTIAGLKKLVESGHINPDEKTVVYVTGNGLKTQDTIAKTLEQPESIKPTLSAFTNKYNNNSTSTQ
ncbi:threonine synthase [Methanohalophilus mahii]|uniref:Threonine synthase n=1 Tax=Methanohalophilus mahii (strain ATCC 35705 / DSM 5219 / SLP) TaxID=547558 RepID=D5EAN1_METMS|nr:threonine synthase [Methanohalophilus mahii]ADE36232.1 L-threonine synthase [Methanohalophilus mahii DSM 5219]